MAFLAQYLLPGRPGWDGCGPSLAALLQGKDTWVKSNGRRREGGAMRVGRVKELQRFPVKSMMGERLITAEVTQRGLAYDRLWATRGSRGKLGSGKNTRRFQRIDRLAEARAHCEAGVPVMTLPNGDECRGDDPRVDDVLSAAFGQPVSFHQEDTETHFDEGPVHLVTTEAIRKVQTESGVSVDPRRLRANLLVEIEDERDEVLTERDWPGLCLSLGPEVVLEVLAPMERCVMVNNLTGDVPHDNRVLRAIAKVTNMMLGVCARVVQVGRISVGDEVCSASRS
jgi:uncharacterized protein YcbX